MKIALLMEELHRKQMACALINNLTDNQRSYRQKASKSLETVTSIKKRKREYLKEISIMLFSKGTNSNYMASHFK